MMSALQSMISLSPDLDGDRFLLAEFGGRVVGSWFEATTEAGGEDVMSVLGWVGESESCPQQIADVQVSAHTA